VFTKAMPVQLLLFISSFGNTPSFLFIPTPVYPASCFPSWVPNSSKPVMGLVEFILSQAVPGGRERSSMMPIYFPLGSMSFVWLVSGAPVSV